MTEDIDLRRSLREATSAGNLNFQAVPDVPRWAASTEWRLVLVLSRNGRSPLDGTAVRRDRYEPFIRERNDRIQ